MSRFVQGADRRQQTLLPECLTTMWPEDNPVRVIDVFVDELDLRSLGFEGLRPAATGRPACHPAMLMKLYVYGYLNKVPSSRRLRAQMAMLKAMVAKVEASPDGQVSLTDPDAHAMATSGRGSGIVGYNVQSAIDGGQLSVSSPLMQRSTTPSTPKDTSSAGQRFVAFSAMQLPLGRQLSRRRWVG